jgi:hypothetical protein
MAGLIGVKAAWMAVLLAAFLAGQFIAVLRGRKVAFHKNYIRSLTSYF